MRAKRGILSFSKESIPLKPPRERTRGLAPRPRTLADRHLKSCAACGIGCGVRGFATGPYVSSPLATAPYYREARVTTARRQTACRMRHYCTRRIDECLGRRKLGCTATRLAERQRIIEAEANRIAMLTRQRRAQVFSFRRHKSRSKSRLPIRRLSFGRSHRPFSFSGKKMGGVVLPPAGGISLRAMRGI